MFESFGFIMNFVPGIFEKIVEEAFEQAMVPENFERARGSCRGETHAAMLLILHEGRFLCGELLQHSCDGRGADAEVLRERGAGHQGLFFATEFKDGFQIIVDGFRRVGTMGCRWHAILDYSPRADAWAMRII